MPVCKQRTYQISKERLNSYKTHLPVNEDGVLIEETANKQTELPILDFPDVNKQTLKNKSKNRSKISGSLLDGGDLMSAPIVSRVWKVPTNIAASNTGKMRLTEVNHGFLKDSN
jgi:hypothetical protein